MSVIIKSLIIFIVCFISILLIYLLIINRFRKEYKDGKNQIEINYLIKKFNLDMKITKYKKVKLIVSFLNSFILSFTFTIIINLKCKYAFKLMIAFIIMFILIYSLYEISGRILKNNEIEKNNDK